MTFNEHFINTWYFYQHIMCKQTVFIRRSQTDRSLQLGFNSLWSSDATWQHTYLGQHWLRLIRNMGPVIAVLKFKLIPHLPGVNESHYGDVIMSATASQITGVSIVYSTVCSGADQRKQKAQRHWPLWGESIGDQWISLTNGQERGKGFHLMTSSWSSILTCGVCRRLQSQWWPLEWRGICHRSALLLIRYDSAAIYKNSRD